MLMLPLLLELSLFAISLCLNLRFNSRWQTSFNSTLHWHAPYCYVEMDQINSQSHISSYAWSRTLVLNITHRNTVSHEGHEECMTGSDCKLKSSE